MEQKLNNTKTILKERPPIVTFMGHVDHGKTSLLDAIRGSRVAEKEHGGITQHISAFQVDHKGKKITFIDTPGHEVFYEMRSRGANVTDVVVLVVAADDGVMPQTKESIKIIKNSNSPFLVAVNKIDTPGANIEKVKQQLAENEVLVEGYGGNVPIVAVSATTKQGLDELLEVVLLMAELEELKDNGGLEGIVVEARNDQYKGAVALVLIKNGRLKVGDQVFVGNQKFKIKALFSTIGEKKVEAIASEPVEILGFDSVPKVGEILSGVDQSINEISTELTRKKLTAADLLSIPKEKIKLIVKADVQGSLEAVSISLKKIEGESDIEIVKEATGEINDSDVLLAASAGARILGFNVGLSSSARRLADTEKVQVKTYTIIYELIEEIEKQSLFKEETAEIVAKAQVLKSFDTPAGVVAGVRVETGKFVVGDNVKILRSSRVIGNTKLTSIRHQAEIVQDATEGNEYGFMFNPALKFDKGDLVEVEHIV